MKKPKHLWLCIGVLCACLALLAGGVILLSNAPETPPAEVVVLQAEDLAAAFGSQVTDSAVTNVYSTVYSASGDYLNLDPVTYCEYIPLYYATKPPQIKARLQSFIDEYLETAADFFGIQSRDYQVKIAGRYKTNYAALVEDTGKSIYFCAKNNLLYTDFNSFDEKQLTVNGSKVSILKTDTDAQITDKLDDAIDSICKAFGKKYSNTRISRSYSADGTLSASVYLYNQEEAGFPENFSAAPLAPDYIRLVFDNATNNEVYLTDVQLCEAVGKWSDFYKSTAKAQMLTLEEAEELLEKGYVFSNHVCDLCMKNQPGADFSDYTYVALEYVFDEDTYRNYNRIKRPCIPFYTFYKYIGETDQGIGSYAKTYVPAIKVDNLEEYFKMQTALHQ